MPQDTEEAMRVILMIGNAVVPAGRDLIRMLARISATVGRTGWKGGKLVAGKALDRFDGMGGVGMVRSPGKLKGPIQSIDVTDRLDRADLHQVAALCRRVGVGFSVSELVADGSKPHTIVQFSAQDASTLQAVLQVALEQSLVDESDLAEACSTPSLADAPIERAGRTWRADGDALRADFHDANGQPMSAVARGDGSWEIRDATGKPALSTGSELRGAADAALGANLGGSVEAASARIGALENPQIARANARLATGPERMRAMSAADVTRAASRAVERKNAAGRPIRQNPAQHLPKQAAVRPVKR